MKKLSLASIILFSLFSLTDVYCIVPKDTTSVSDNDNKAKFIFAFDARNAFSLDHKVKMSGLKIGIEVNRVHRFGLGFYSNRDPIIFKLPDQQDLQGEINFGYTALFYEHVVYQNKKWEFSAPVFFGGGEAKLRILLPDGSYLIHESNNDEVLKVPLTFTGATFTGQYKIWSWLGIGSGIGYRFILSKNDDAKRAFSSPLYVIKVKVFIGEIIKALKKKPKTDKVTESKE